MNTYLLSTKPLTQTIFHTMGKVDTPFFSIIDLTEKRAIFQTTLLFKLAIFYVIFKRIDFSDNLLTSKIK